MELNENNIGRIGIYADTCIMGDLTVNCIVNPKLGWSKSIPNIEHVLVENTKLMNIHHLLTNIFGLDSFKKICLL